MKHDFGALALAIAALTGLSSAAHAQAIAGQGTWESSLQGRDLDGNAANGFEAYYDKSLNVSWLADAGAGGIQTWSAASDWVAQLNVHGVTGWRLPNATDLGDPGCAGKSLSGGDCGYNIDTGSSELAHMYHVTLGNKSPLDAFGNEQTGWGLTNKGPFTGLRADGYWTRLSYAPDPDAAWTYLTDYGAQTAYGKGASFSTWAVHDGDVALPSGVTSAVPEPGSIALLMAGVGVTLVARRRR